MDYQTLILVLIVGILLGGLLFLWVRKLLGNLALWWRFRKARAAEKKAEKLLKKQGYKIIEKQFPSPIRIKVDDEIFETFVRPDFLVEKDGLCYVAEIKTGEAASILNSATRRQLLEYDYAFSPDGILLVDMEERKIHTVEFGEGKT